MDYETEVSAKSISYSGCGGFLTNTSSEIPSDTKKYIDTLWKVNK